MTGGIPSRHQASEREYGKNMDCLPLAKHSNNSLKAGGLPRRRLEWPRDEKNTAETPIRTGSRGPTCIGDDDQTGKSKLLPAI